jgi:glyoxylase-like metal-dependent hydrolase (beta-lactamase superfamily II)
MALKMKKKLKRLYYKRKLNPDYKLFDGSELPHFSDWKAIHAPGHTSHNIMLYNEENKLLYIADAIIDTGGKYLPPVPVLFPVQMKRSLSLIKEIKPDIILLAHSPSPFLEYNEEMIDKTLHKVDAKDPVFIRMFYLISKFTGEYKMRREKIQKW